MVFRRDSNRIDSFQRQMNSLRQQIGTDEVEDDELDRDPRDRGSQSQDRARSRPPGDDGYSFGNFPSEGVSTASSEPMADEDDEVAIPEMPRADQQVSVIAAGTTWNGELESQGSIHVYGNATGSLKAADDIWIAGGAEVDASIEADRVIIAGAVAGSISARSRFEALPDGELRADVTAPTFVVHEGATINGELSMTGRDSRATRTPDPESRSRSASIIQRRNRQTS